MPRKKVPCPKCGQPKAALSKCCRDCATPYVRTKKHRQQLSATLAGRESPMLGKKRPEHSAYMKKWWTKERRAKMSQRQLDPNARYHGLSSRMAARIVRQAGQCNRCGHDGSKSRLGVHHRNRDKHDQRRKNLEVLCHRCHMQEHRHEVGWAAYWKKRRTSQD